MSDKYSDSKTSVHAILSNLWALARGTLDGLRLSAAERLTLLLSAIAVAAIAAVLVTAVLLFASIGAAQLLSSITPDGAYFIVAGFYALLLLLLFLLRRPLIVDPVSRLVTRLLVPPPQETPVETQTPRNNDEDKE